MFYKPYILNRIGSFITFYCNVHRVEVSRIHLPFTVQKYIYTFLTLHTEDYELTDLIKS